MEKSGIKHGARKRATHDLVSESFARMCTKCDTAGSTCLRAWLISTRVWDALQLAYICAANDATSEADDSVTAVSRGSRNDLQYHRDSSNKAPACNPTAT
jgi:hypothetical protein